MARSISLNADAGEGARDDRALIPLLDRVSVACGGHAGDERSLRATIALAARHGVKLGAHPSYPDRAGFGRCPRAVSMGRAMTSIRAQVGACAAAARRLRVPLDHVKLHGALYHEASVNAPLAALIATMIRSLAWAGGSPVAWLGPPGSLQERMAGIGRVPFLREGFADRRYTRDGGLAARGTKGAVLGVRAAVRQARRLTVSGIYDTLCVHSDTPGCVAIARAIRRASG